METHWLDKKITSVVRLPSLSKCSQFHVGFFKKTFDISQASMQIKVLSHALFVPFGLANNRIITSTQNRSRE